MSGKKPNDHPGTSAVNPHARQCRAKSRKTGRRCPNPAVSGGEFCRMHGGKPQDVGGKENRDPRSKGKNARGSGHARRTPTSTRHGNRNAVKHGAYALQLQPEEKAIYDSRRAQFTEQLGSVDIFDGQVVHMLALIAATLAISSWPFTGTLAEAIYFVTTSAALLIPR